MGNTIIFALVLLISQSGSGTLQFASSIAEHVGKHLGTEYLVLISKDSHVPNLREVGSSTPTAFISYDVNYEERKVAENLKELRLAGYLNLLVFLDDGHERLLRILVNELQLFNTGVSCLILETDFSEQDLKLQFDTKLFYYSEEKKYVGVWETYAVNGITIKDQIGAWNDSHGLSIPSANMVNIWDRRTSLHGLTVNVTSINRRHLHEIYYEGYPKEYNPNIKYLNGLSELSVTGGGGIFLEPLNILSAHLNFTLNLTASIDDKWGSMNNEGDWNGMIGMIVRGEADVAAASLTRKVLYETLCNYVFG